MPAATLPEDLAHRFVNVNGIRMHYVECGEGETVVFLHGFPESWYSWRHQLAALSDGYRCIAPDLRGYGETDNEGPYDVATIQRDVLALIEAVGGGPVHVVGHDWGGAIAWLLAINHPEAVRSLAVCNIPHPALMASGLRRPRQLLRSWYIFFFQLPWLPERMLGAKGYQALARGIIRDCRPGTFTREDVMRMLATWRAHGLSGGINWYRALLRHPARLPQPPNVAAPTTLIWGEDDVALGIELTYGTERYVEDLEVHYLPNTSHWVQQEEPGRVTELLRQHLDRAGRR